MDIILVSISAVSISFLLYFAFILHRYAKKSIFFSRESETPSTQHDPPTVSICIPARNENHALTECLSSVIASRFSKLEILVLDDCSQDKTPQIIRGFSHEGVRFIQGETPSDGWLGKNNAYRELYKQARGEYVIFMSVDTRLEEHTIDFLTDFMVQQRMSMVSVLPVRDHRYVGSILFAPLRYFWQLALAQEKKPPVSTSLWAIHADTFDEAGGFELYKDEILIENKLATTFSAQKRYTFFSANVSLGAVYAKHWNSQIQTVVRLFYPMMRRSYLLSVGAFMAYTLIVVAPIMLAVIDSSYVAVLLCYSALIIGVYAYYIWLTTRKAFLALFSIASLPYVLMQEAFLMLLSCFQYARGKVDWKGRNICFPSALRHDDKQ